MKFINIDPKKLVANSWNTNEVSPHNEEKLTNSIKHLGFFKPIICREVHGGILEIIGGEHRVNLAIQENMKEVPVINLGDISEQKAKEISLIDNARYGEDDPTGLSELLKSIGDIDTISSIMPYSEAEISELLKDVKINFDDLNEIDEDEEIRKEEPKQEQMRTHTILKFKVALGDDERIMQLIENTARFNGFNESDQLLNYGDALAHLLLTEGAK